MRDGLYHRDLGLPNIAIASGYNLRWTSHAKEQASYRNVWPRPARVDNLTNANIVELEILNGKPIKALLRVPYNSYEDMVMALNLTDGAVRTIWLNSKTDQHNTLDYSKYTKPI